MRLHVDVECIAFKVAFPEAVAFRIAPVGALCSALHPTFEQEWSMNDMEWSQANLTGPSGTRPSPWH